MRGKYIQMIRIDMKRLALLLSFAMFFSQHAQADTSSSHEHKNLKTSGNCHVSTLVDMFTDEEEHVFICDRRDPDRQDSSGSPP